jgi:hypothetical protein
MIVGPLSSQVSSSGSLRERATAFRAMGPHISSTISRNSLPHPRTNSALDYGVPAIPPCRIITYESTSVTKLLEALDSNRATLYIDYKVMELS